MWDEQERVEQFVGRGCLWALAALGIAVSLAGLIMGTPELLLAFLQFLGLLGALAVGWTLVSGALMALMAFSLSLGECLARVAQRRAWRRGR